MPANTWTLGALRARVLGRLGDLDQLVWPAGEIDQYLQAAYRDLAASFALLFDVAYLDNLPGTFSHTAAWELKKGYVSFRLSLANYTSTDELRALDEPHRVGPARATSPFEAADGWIAAAEIPATSPMPADITALDRSTYDTATLDAALPRQVRQLDSRYEITKGPVFALLWAKDGVNVARKVRVPAAACDTVFVAGTWGALRTPADLSGDTVVGTWGVCRRLPGHHPMGPTAFGSARQPHLEGKNVRIEYFRHGQAIAGDADVCELPDRYALYLCDYAQARALERAGPGQDPRLAQHFLVRWQRNRARLDRRLRTVTTERAGVLGGTRGPMFGGAVRYPKLPWNYGRVVR